jgi:hypothetical protein
MTKFVKGKSGNPGGKPHGATDLSARDVRKIVIDVMIRLGGAAWLEKFARKNDANARVFVALAARTMPTRVEGPDGMPLVVIKEYRGVDFRKPDEDDLPVVIDGESSPVVDFKDTVQ